MTHCSCEVVMPRSDWIDGSATPTIETSSASRKSAAHSTRMSPQARGPKRAAAAAPGRAETDTGKAPCGEVVPPWERGGAGRRDVPLLFDGHRTKLFGEGQTMADTPPADLVTVLQALSDPVRLEMVRQLARCEEGEGIRCGE